MQRNLKFKGRKERTQVSFKRTKENGQLHGRCSKVRRFSRKGRQAVRFLNKKQGLNEVKSLAFGPVNKIMESLILAQNERWRRVLNMQVERQEKSLLFS